MVECVTILILVDGFLQYYARSSWCFRVGVTILILVDGFLQSFVHTNKQLANASHNPYFSRWFSAISHHFTPSNIYSLVTILILVDGFLQYNKLSLYQILNYVTILILVDGFLQWHYR